MLEQCTVEAEVFVEYLISLFSLVVRVFMNEINSKRNFNPSIYKYGANTKCILEITDRTKLNHEILTQRIYTSTVIS